MKLGERFKRLSLWNKIGVVGSLASLLGVLLAAKSGAELMFTVSPIVQSIVQVGSVAINTGTGTIHIENRYGISEARFQQLSEELGVTQAALQGFFRSLNQNGVLPEDLQSSLYAIAQDYKALRERVNKLESPEIGTQFGANSLYSAARTIVGNDFELFNMPIIISRLEVEYQSRTLRNTISFEAALRSVLKSFLEDGSEIESPVALTANMFSNISEEERRRILINHMNRPSTKLTLVSFGTGIGSPEGRELIQDNWIFCLAIESFSDHLHWAVVDRSGNRATYNYGFN